MRTDLGRCKGIVGERTEVALVGTRSAVGLVEACSRVGEQAVLGACSCLCFVVCLSL